MPRLNSNEYDAVIIGAGISGLVCGCYLAKAGMKVLIADQHHKPGGYCTSFQRGRFTFDAAAHSLGGLKHGILGKVFDELGIKHKMQFLQFDPSDIVLVDNYRVSFWRHIDSTINELQIMFPKERDNIQHFFCLFINPAPLSLARMRNWTFKELLDLYFSDYKLKSIIAFPLFGNTGLPPSEISAVIGFGIFKECILDGGYYPKGGMQALSNALVELFEESGGKIKLSCRAKKIGVRNQHVSGVTLEKVGFVSSEYVVSNCDARQTFFKLLGREVVRQDVLSNVKDMMPSLSSFILYLGVERFPALPQPGTNIWVMSQYDLDDAYISARQGNFDKIGGYLLHVSSDGRSMVASIFAPFKNSKFWMNNKLLWEDFFIKRLEKDIVPELSRHIAYRASATPLTLFRYTLNHKGAAYGWAGIPSQLARPDMNKVSSVQGLYLTGHWATRGLGIPGVTYVAYETAKSVLRNAKRPVMEESIG